MITLFKFENPGAKSKLASGNGHFAFVPRVSVLAQVEDTS